MKKQNIWLWALTAAVVLLAAALAETQGQLGELQTAYSALQQEVGELRLDLKSTQNRLQEQEEALERAAAQTAPQPEESLLERYELTPLRLDAAAHQVELGVSLTRLRRTSRRKPPECLSGRRGAQASGPGGADPVRGWNLLRSGGGACGQHLTPDSGDGPDRRRYGHRAAL